MIFNSIEYLLFFPLVFMIYWLVKEGNIKIQNIILLAASYIFYGWWDWRFLFLLLFSTGLDFWVGLKIYDAKTNKAKQIWMWFSVIINLGFLGYFKYFNFFIESWITAWHSIGYDMNITTTKIILPVGISFYTFHGLSYVIDIYNNRIKPTRNWNNYSLFVSFFPLLVAGPIERATHLLPQIEAKRSFSLPNAISGLRQILWGLFKKVAVADQCSIQADQIFNNFENYNATTLALGAIIFSFQIYADFSGYSDIALGSARLLGFELFKNFNYPYFSKSIPEFWHKWHISLSSWLNDYVFTPLALEFRNWSKFGIFLAVFLTFVISGFWHGAGWTFIIWGALHGLYYIPNIFWGSKKISSISSQKIKPLNQKEPLEIHKILSTFLLVSFTLIFFRSPNLNDAFQYCINILNPSLWGKLQVSLLIPSITIFVMLLFEWNARKSTTGIEVVLQKLPLPLRWAVYYGLTFAVITFSDKSGGFIYFQF